MNAAERWMEINVVTLQKLWHEWMCACFSARKFSLQSQGCRDHRHEPFVLLAAQHIYPRVDV